MKKRTIEVFTAGCPCCDEAVRLVRSLACESYDVQVLDMRTDRAVQVRGKEYGIQRAPVIVVNGQLANCCRSRVVDAGILRTLGVGTPAERSPVMCSKEPSFMRLSVVSGWRKSMCSSMSAATWPPEGQGAAHELAP